MRIVARLWPEGSAATWLWIGRNLVNGREVIIEVGAEGGSIALYGFRTDQGWLFTRQVADQTPELIDEEWIEKETPRFESWETALKLLDRYSWAKLYPLTIHPEFREQIWSAVQERLRNDDGSELHLSRWRELCHG
jgi:hypothetical protein